MLLPTLLVTSTHARKRARMLRRRRLDGIRYYVRMRALTLCRILSLSLSLARSLLLLSLRHLYFACCFSRSPRSPLPLPHGRNFHKPSNQTSFPCPTCKAVSLPVVQRLSRRLTANRLSLVSVHREVLRAGGETGTRENPVGFLTGIEGLENTRPTTLPTRFGKSDSSRIHFVDRGFLHVLPEMAARLRGSFEEIPD